MKKIIIWMVCIISIISLPTMSNETPLKVLHISFHKGCLNDFTEVVKEVGGMHLTSWYAFSPPKGFDGETFGFNLYNMGHDRAKKIWDLHKDFFNTFDVVVTSDTTPLSRIFLQNNFKKNLIVWVCNRFDYHHQVDMDCLFPDEEYYQLINKAIHMKNVKIVLYTPFEKTYAQRKGVFFKDLIIKPIGLKETEINEEFKSRIPTNVKKEETIFLYPTRASKEHHHYIMEHLQKLGIKFHFGNYNGPEDLKGFKGVIYFPYQASNLVLFENFQRGLVHFVPSEKFLAEQRKNGAPLKPFIWGASVKNNEWYSEENSEYIVHFDSWEDLQYKIEYTDYETMSKKIRAFGKKHRETMIQRWKNIFDEIKLSKSTNYTQE